MVEKQPIFLKVLLLFFLCGFLAAGAGAAPVIKDLQIDYQTRPMALESPSPLFSWRMEADGQESHQVAYAITVVDEFGVVTWNTGKVTSPDSVAIPYEGKPLEPTTRYEWQVRVWSGSDKTSMATSYFETGFMVDNDQAWPDTQWIGGGPESLPLYANYLTVFQISADLKIDEPSKSEKAAFVFGGNDFRLMSRHFNIQRISNVEDAGFVAVELDIGPLIENGNNALVNVYRVGYDPDDSRAQPLASMTVPNRLIDRQNAYDTHSIAVRSVFGLLTIYVNGLSDEHRVFTGERENTDRQGLNINPVAFGGGLKPTGNPADYISFPALGDIGFWIKKGHKATFSRLSVRNVREPANVLFETGVDSSSGYEHIFSQDGQTTSVSRGPDGAIKIDALNDDSLVMADPSRLSTPMLRTEFDLSDKAIKKARLYATARGIYELYINGRRVGDRYFTPGLTQYSEHHAYQSYDVTEALVSGDTNAMGAWLGEGWWSGNTTYTGTNWNFFGDRQSLHAKLIVTYEDGSTQSVSSNSGNWKVYSEGPIRYGSFFQGEVYDARRERDVAGWTTPGFEGTGWEPASVVPLEGSAFIAEGNPNPNSQEVVTGYDDMDLVGQQGDGPSIVKTLVAQSVDEVRPGVFVYDMGQNMVGFPRIELSGTKRGQHIVTRYAEMKYPELPEHEGLAGMVMMENIRGALSHDTYITKGGEETFQPRFTFHGYRYIEITGLDAPLPLSAVQGKVVSSISELTASYETSNDRVNKLWENITWSMRSNFLSIPTDTPARNERMGWSGDINVFAPTATLMADVDPFLRRHLLAMRDLQGDNGRFTDVAPVGGGFGGVLWGTAGVTIPWELYRQYGDRNVLAAHYAAMKRYLDFLWSRRDPETGILVEGPLGDWLSPVGRKNDNTLLWEAYHLRALEIVVRVAGLLDKQDDATVYRQRYEKRKAFFNDTYVDKDSGKTVHSGMIAGFFADPSKRHQIDKSLRGSLIDTQASYAVPIAQGAFNDANLDHAFKHLAASVKREAVDDQGKTRPGCSLMTGFIGTASLMDALAASGRDELAYCLLQNDRYPSWLYSVENGATTIWERLNSYTREDGFGGNNSMNSFNHYSFGSVGAWMVNHSLGIQRDPDYPAFKRFVFKPTPDETGEMTWASGHYDSMYGRIESSWRHRDNATKYEFLVPSNTVATLCLPLSDGGNVRFEKGEGRKTAVADHEDFCGNRATYQLLPGRYRLTVTPD